MERHEIKASTDPMIAVMRDVTDPYARAVRGECAKLIGVVFDSNLGGWGDAYAYRADERTVAVDSACILEILSKVYEASRIVDEIKTASRR
jgi:Peptidase S46